MRPRSLTAYLALYVATYAGFGVASPFLPSLWSERGLSASQIGLLLAIGTAVRLVSAPLGGQIADRLHRPRVVLFATLAASAGVALLYLPASTVVTIGAVSLLHAATLAPVTPTADALALGQRASFDYGWVRGAGSAAFVVGTFLVAPVIDRFGLVGFLPLNAAFLAVAALCVVWLPAPPLAQPSEANRAGDLRALFANRAFRRLVVVAALILSSHAMHDAFAVIRWRAAGFSSTLISVLWSEAVVAEVAVFTLIGPWVLRRWTPARCIALAAVAGILRWVVVSQTLAPALIACVEPLHGLTFALLHLSAMRVIASTVPQGIAASAQALYGVVAAGAAGALMTLASGPLYERFGGDAFLAMAGLCVLALPFAWALGQTSAGRIEAGRIEVTT